MAESDIKSTGANAANAITPEIKSTGANAANAITPAIGSRLRSYGIIVVAVTVLAFLGLTRSHFMSLPNIYSLFYGVSLDFYCVAGFTILIIMGEIDLSVGSVYGLAGTTAGYLATQGLPIWLCTAAALGIGIFVGLFNGLLVVHLRINSIILTIGTLLLVRGLADVVAAKMAGERYIEAFRDIARARVFSVNWTIIALLVLLTMAEFAMVRSAVGRAIYYIGNNRRSALIHGISVGWYRVAGFALSGALASISGVLVASRITLADVNMGRQLEFTILTAAVLGGASLFGGRGQVVNSIVSYFFLAMILNGLIMFGVEPHLQQVIVGAVLIVIVGLDAHLNREAR